MRPRAPMLWKRSMHMPRFCFSDFSESHHSSRMPACLHFARYSLSISLLPDSPPSRPFSRLKRIEEMFTFGGAPQMDLARAASEAAHFRPIFSNQVELVTSCSIKLCLMTVRAGDLIWLDMCTDVILWIEDRELTGLELVTSAPQVQRETYDNSALRQLMRSGTMSQRWDGWLSKEQSVMQIGLSTTRFERWQLHIWSFALTC